MVIFSLFCANADEPVSVDSVVKKEYEGACTSDLDGKELSISVLLLFFVSHFVSHFCRSDRLSLGRHAFSYHLDSLSLFFS